MKRLLLTSIIILALLVGAPSVTTHVYANASDTVTGTVGAQPAIDAAAAEAAAKSTSDLKEKTDEGYNYIMMKIMGLFAWLVGVAAITLEYAVYYTVVNMGSYLNNLSAIGIAWEVLRDVGNIMLIFGFLAIGISVILNTERLGYGKKMLPMLLVAAVFLNFSLFFAEAIIDTGNLFATQFYTQINGGTPPTALSIASLNTSNEGISNKLMAQLGLQTIYGQATNPDKAKEIFRGANPWFIGFLGILLFIVTAFVLFSLAFILIARFVMLIFLIILAPIGFAGLAIPKLASTAHKWWSTLFEQTITAPVLLLMLYIALRVITDAKFLTGFDAGQNADWFGTINSNLSGFGAIFLTFLVAMGLLIAVTITAKRISAFGAGAAMKGAGALSFGATAWATRNTVGLGANYLAKKARSSRLARVPLVGTGIVRGLEKTASSSFDIRGVKAGGGLKGLGVEAGEAQKGGYKEELKKRVESRTKYAADLKGKDFNDLSEEQQVKIAGQERDIEKLKKDKTDAQKAGTLNATTLKKFNEDIKKQEEQLDTLHKEAGTERGAKLDYASRLANLPPGFKYLTSNKEAAKKIKEEARKSKDDKELDTLRKALKKAGGEEEKPKEKPKEEKEKPDDGDGH